MDAPELLRQLHLRGLVEGPESEVSIPSTDAITDRPWYISLLLGASAWISGIFMLVFVVMLFKPDRPPTALATGVVLLLAAWGLFKADRKGAFASQLALALSVAGQFAVIFAISEGLFRGNRNIAPVAFSALLLQLALVALMPNRLHRGMSALFACIAWALALRFGLWDHSWQPVAARPGDPASSPLRAVVGWALVWLPVAGALALLVRTEAAWMARRWQAILRPAAGGLIVGLAIGTLLSYPMESLRWWTDRMDAHEQWLALWPLLSALAALGALAAAFALGSRGLMGVCVAAALLHISHFYYAMGTSLLVKSITLLILGGLMLWGARHVRRMGANP